MEGEKELREKLKELGTQTIEPGSDQQMLMDVRKDYLDTIESKLYLIQHI